MKVLEEKIASLLEKQDWNPEFSLSLAVGQGYRSWIYNFGKEYKFYDLASLTKVLFGALYCIEEKILDKKVSSILPWLKSSEAGVKIGSKIKVVDLLAHQAGLPAHKKYYEIFKDRAHLENLLKQDLRSEVEGLKSSAPAKVLYSDLDYLLLSFVVEEHSGLPLDELLPQFLKKAKLRAKFFYPRGRNYSKSFYAPTEECHWRKKKIQGEVFDDNAAFFDRPFLHAGLFGGIKDMLIFGKWLRSYYKKRKRMFSKNNGEFASGFMIPTGASSSAGKYFSPKSIGHLGFTGTSFWYDPKVDLYVCILSNRTYPDREDKSFNSLRAEICNIIFEELIGASSGN